MRAHIDTQRVELVLDTLLKQHAANGFPYNLPAAVLPQDPRHLPQGLTEDPRQHAMWLFCLCYYMRGGIKSVTAAKQLSRLYVRRQTLFEAEKAALAEELSVRESLIRVQLKYLCNTVPHYWIENAQRLVEWHDGDVRNIFAGVSTYEEACLRICNRSRRKPKSDKYTHRQGFCGFQEKMVSMLIYYLVEAGLIEAFPFSVPIDFHALRVSVATEMVVFRGVGRDRDVFSEELRAALRRTFLEYAVEHEVNPIELTDALWLLSSTICSRHPGNITYSGAYSARSTELRSHKPTWSDVELRAHQASCGQCPVQPWCDWDVPNAQYTRKGQLLLLRRRSRPQVS